MAKRKDESKPEKLPAGSARAQGLEILAKYHKPGDDWTAELLAERRIDLEDARAALKEAEEKGTVPLRDLMRELGD